MSLREAIASLQQGSPFSVTRTAAGSRELGRYVAGADSSFDIIASVQPVTGRELRDLPEGQRGDEVWVLYTLTPLFTRRAGFEPDVITINGEAYTVVKVERFDAFGGTHYRAYAARTGRP